MKTIDYRQVEKMGAATAAEICSRGASGDMRHDPILLVTSLGEPRVNGELEPRRAQAAAAVVAALATTRGGTAERLPVVLRLSVARTLERAIAGVAITRTNHNAPLTPLFVGDSREPLDPNYRHLVELASGVPLNSVECRYVDYQRDERGRSRIELHLTHSVRGSNVNRATLTATICVVRAADGSTCFSSAPLRKAGASWGAVRYKRGRWYALSQEDLRDLIERARPLIDEAERSASADTT